MFSLASQQRYLHRQPRPSRVAFTLVEVMVAVGVFAMIAVAILSAQTFASRAARINANNLSARNLAQKYLEQMTAMAATISNAYPTTGKDPFDVDPITGGTFIRTAYNTARTEVLDTALNINATVTFTFKGDGYLTAASSTVLTDSSASWTSNEWQGNTVFIVSGTGAGAYAKIASNTANTLTLSTALSLNGVAVVPSTSTSASPIYNYRINNGLTVVVTVTWPYRGRTYSVNLKGLLIPSKGFSSSSSI